MKGDQEGRQVVEVVVQSRDNHSSSCWSCDDFFQGRERVPSCLPNVTRKLRTMGNETLVSF